MKTLKQIFNAIKDDYLKRSPRGKWKFVRNTAIFILKICGVAAIDLNFKVTWYSFACAVVVLDVFLSFLYTVWYYSGGIEGFLVIPVIGIVFSVSFYMFFFFAIKASMLHSCVFFANYLVMTKDLVLPFNFAEYNKFIFFSDK